MLKNTFSNQPAKQLLSQPGTLAILSYDDARPERVIDTKLRSFKGDAENIFESWSVDDGPIVAGNSGDCFWKQSDHFQIVAITVACTTNGDYETQTALAYRAVLKQISDSDFPNLVRFWNLIPHINHGDGEQENYKTFCTGRLNVFEEFSYDDSQFPSASCLGHYQQGIVVYAISSKYNAEHIANPRQINAYSYPKQYGKSSPSFARATSLTTHNSQLCFISGTASILGHNTVHEGDIVGQLHTTNDNILYLLKEAGQSSNSVQSLRVYIRHEQDFDVTRKMVDEWYPHQEIIYTHADICRADLLVEIECFCSFDLNQPVPA